MNEEDKYLAGIEEEMQEKLDQVYAERTACAAALARMILRSGGTAGVGYDETCSNPFVLYMDTPSGQVSYHVSEEDAWMLKDLPPYEGKWDGTFRGREHVWCSM